LLLSAARPVSGQTNRSFDDLGRYLHAGDPVFVVERAEGASQGVVVRVTPTELVVLASGQERRLTENMIGWIETSPDSIADGAGTGAILGLTFGLTSMVFGCPECGLLFIGGGAAAGAGLDWSVKGRRMVYGRQPRISFLRKAAPVSSLGEIWSRVRPGQKIRVRSTSGMEHRGTFVKASPDSITIQTESTHLVVPSAQVQMVQAKTGLRGTWIWVAMGLGAAGGLLRSHDDTNRHATREDTAKGLFLGGLVGLGVAAATAPYDYVFRSAPPAEPRVTLSPLIGRDRRGATVTLRF
jgi:hypothetical protein